MDLQARKDWIISEKYERSALGAKRNWARGRCSEKSKKVKKWLMVNIGMKQEVRNRNGSGQSKKQATSQMFVDSSETMERCESVQCWEGNEPWQIWGSERVAVLSCKKNALTVDMRGC